MAIFDNRRQSAPRDTAQGFLSRLFGRGSAEAQEAPGDGAMTPNEALMQPIGREQVMKAEEIRQMYSNGKKAVERRIVDNEKWYRGRHWDVLKHDESQVRPSSGWLWNMVANKHADAMDNYPRANVRPREEGDKAEAEALSEIIPVVLEQADFEGTYSDVALYKIKQGTGVYYVGWDPQAAGGKGDIQIKKTDILNLFWEPGVSDIQDSPNLFYAYRVDRDTLISQYPQLDGKVTGDAKSITDYVHDDQTEVTPRVTVVDWYYKKRSGGRSVLHFCRYVNDIVLYATENADERKRQRGLYDHGRYPFEFDTVYSVEGSPVGLGYIDRVKSAQEQIDRLNKVILENALQGAKPRYFERIDGSINEEEFTDLSRSIIHVSGNLGDDAIRPVDQYPLSEIYVGILDRKIDELKEVSGNRDISTGGTTSGVTAASAIAAMQEAGAKLTRDFNKASYRTFRQIVRDVIELIRQFYDVPRQFRILGDDGKEAFVTYQNTGLAPVAIRNEDGDVVGYRTPIMDVEVTAEKASPYTRLAQNELALDFYNRGFFNPELSDQALATLEMMDFDGKAAVTAKIAENGTMFEQIQALKQMVVRLAEIVDKAQKGGNNAAQAAAMLGAGMPAAAPPNAGGDSSGLNVGAESSVTANARERAAAATEVR